VRRQAFCGSHYQAEVLLVGETGTGKGLLARMIHAWSPRAEGSFVTVNIAAIPKELLAGELFGYEKGAFTGAVTSREGLLERADGGTLFLDEVEAIPLDVQASLLSVLEDRQFRRIGRTEFS